MGKQERDDRLESLRKATKKYRDKVTERLNNQLAFGKRVLKGRGSDGLNNSSVKQATDLVVDAISDFVEV